MANKLNKSKTTSKGLSFDEEGGEDGSAFVINKNKKVDPMVMAATKKTKSKAKLDVGLLVTIYDCDGDHV